MVQALRVLDLLVLWDLVLQDLARLVLGKLGRVLQDLGRLGRGRLGRDQLDRDRLGRGQLGQDLLGLGQV